MGQTQVRVWGIAQEHGLSAEQATELVVEISHNSGFGVMLGGRVTWNDDEASAVSVILDALGNGGLPPGPRDDQRELSELDLLSCLARSADPRGAECLVRRAQDLLRQPIHTQDQQYYLRIFFYLFGVCADDRAVEKLFLLQSSAFWDGPEAPVIDVSPLPTMDRQETAEYLKRQLRMYALQGLAASGTERALEAFGTWTGVEVSSREELDMYFDETVEASVYSHGTLASTAEEKRAAYLSLYAKYGRTVPSEDEEAPSRAIGHATIK